MAKATEISCITSLGALEQREREEQTAREQRWQREVAAAQRRVRFAEQDRKAALHREQEQHAARLVAMQQAIVERARAEAESRHLAERLAEIHAHEQAMARLEMDRRQKSLRRWLGVTALTLLGVGAFGALLLAEELDDAQQAALRRERESSALRQQLAVSEQQLQLALDTARASRDQIRVLRAALEDAHRNAAP